MAPQPQPLIGTLHVHCPPRTNISISPTLGAGQDPQTTNLRSFFPLLVPGSRRVTTPSPLGTGQEKFPFIRLEPFKCSLRDTVVQQIIFGYEFAGGR